MLKNIVNKLSFVSSSKDLLHFTDIHSHLISDIDDGVKTLDESVELILQLKELGFKKIITTPHIMLHRFPNTRKIISTNYLELLDKLKERNIDIELKVAAEYYYDEHFLELIEKKELMTFGDNYILFELSYRTKPFGLEYTVSKLLKAGYKPILAHPERYTYYKTKADYLKLKEMGVFFQINAISTKNFYGKNVKKAVENIIDLGIVDFVGSDIHAQNYFDTFSKVLKSKTYINIFKKNNIKNDYL